MTDPAFSLDEYNALRTGCGVVPLADWSSVTLTGADRQKFLNSFCTNDVKRLVPGEHCEAFITNVKGKITGHGLVVCRENELVYITVPGQAAKVIEHLDRYIIREDVQLRDTTAERTYLLIAGGASVSVPAELSHWIRWRIFEVEVCGLLEVDASDVDSTISQLKAAGGTLCSTPTFNAVRIESGMPLYDVDFNGDNLPQEVGRDEEAISFTKGCYLGQETVARIDALGHVNQQITGVRFAGSDIPAIGCELTANGAVVGRVTSATRSPQLNAPLALAMIKRSASALGTQLASAAGPCEVVELPLKI
jgi:tRNA-modifying protein YgfZ